jgi:hypothetical protein
MENLTKVDSTQEEIVEQIVTFHEDGDVAVVDEVPPEVPMVYRKVAEDDLQHTVVDILERPIEVANFTWELASAAGTELSSVELPADWLSVNMIKEKLSGFTFFRADFEVKVQVNAQPFHAGNLLVVFEPLAGQQQYTPSNMLHFGGVTGYRHVNLDLSESTSAMLTIPFLTNLTYFDLIKAIGQLGRVRMFVYSALTGSTDVEGTIWIRARNVSVDMPTGVSPWPRAVGKAQSGGNPSRSRIPVANASGPKVNPPKVRREEEKEEKIPGVFTRIALGIKDASRAVMGVPIIAPYAACVTWLAGAAAGICSVFGWSKPLDRARTKMVQLTYARSAANYNGDSKAKVLALDSQNEVTFPSEVFGTNEDEMSFGHILSKFTFLDRFTMIKAFLPGQVMWKMPVSPRACSKLIDGDKIMNLNTMLSYFSEMFTNWRGTIKYKFRTVKTNFHSARIRVAFVPGIFEDTPPEGIDVNKVYSQIFDLREVTEFEFEVPFVYNQPWLSLIDVDRSALSASVPTGMLYVEVLNSLRNPAAAADYIEFIVEVAAGEDFQFAYPRVNRNINLIPKLPQANFKVAKAPSSLLVRKIGQVTRLDYKAPVVEGNKIGSFSMKDVMMVRRPKNKEMMVSSKTAVQVDDGDAASVASTSTEPRTVDVPRAEERVKPDPFQRMTYTEIAKLPLAKGAVTAVVRPGVHPTHLYTLFDQQQMWNEWIRNNPNADREQAWDLFSYQYPDDTRYSNEEKRRFKREAGVVQSKMIQRKADTSPELNVFGMGEIVTSTRQLLKRFELLGDIAVTTDNATGIMPYVSAGWAANQAGFNQQLWNSAYDRIASVYRWQCGAMRLGVMPQLNVTESTRNNTAWSQPGFNSILSPSGGSRFVTSAKVTHNTAEAVVPIFPATEKWVELQLPMYQRVPAIPTSVGAIAPADLDRGSMGQDFIPANHGTTAWVSGPTFLSVWRSIGEDFSLGYLLGPPLTGSD